MDQVLELRTQVSVLDLAPTAIWLYDAAERRNVWGNKAALELFNVGDERFCAQQAPPPGLDEAAAVSWLAKADEVHATVQDGEGTLSICAMGGMPAPPGFLPIQEHKLQISASYKPIRVARDGKIVALTLVQVLDASSAEDRLSRRMVDMCDNHPMFQFLFDESGKLLAANKRAMTNMTEHLGVKEVYNLEEYLARGECDSGADPHVEYQKAMDGIFVRQEVCARIKQLRWSKRYPGKYRWVLYEMWPLMDPVRKTRAVLVTEQNISQVKEVEEMYHHRTLALEAELQEALLAQRDPMHKPLIDIDTPADKTLKMIDKILRGSDITPDEAMDLRNAIVKSRTLNEPINLNEQLLQNPQKVYDAEVSESLLQLLGRRTVLKNEEEDLEDQLEMQRPSSITRRNDASTAAAAAHNSITMQDVREMVVLCRNLPTELDTVLATANEWQFDAFALDEASSGRPLSLLGFYLLKQSKIISRFELDELKLARYLMRIEAGYPANPYHNRIHAADVLQSLHVLLVRGGLMTLGFCDELAMLSCYMSAITHDYEHKGVNNDFLIRVSDSLAVLYNDKSPMENHHLAAAFQLANVEDYNYMKKMPNKTKELMRKQMIDMVLATDMKQHFAISNMFQTKMSVNVGTTRTSNGGLVGGKLSRQNSTMSHGEERKLDDDLKSLALQVALKCADLGHLASPRSVHRRWVQLLEEEFFRQGDKEKVAGLTVSPLMDREKNGITKSQVGFFDIVAMPLFQNLSHIFADATPLLEAVRDNYNMWKDESLHASR